MLFLLPGNKPVSPYSGYSGQLRSSVYQPTELALISKVGGNVSTDLAWLHTHTVTYTLAHLFYTLTPHTWMHKIGRAHV